MSERHALEKETEPVKLDKNVLSMARRDGIVASVVSGFLGGLLGQRYFRFNRNQTLLSGILTCICSGYMFTQAFLGTRITEAVNRETQRRRQAASSELIPDETLQISAKGGA